MRSSADTLKRVTLELGGKSPNIVFADSDIDSAVKGALTASSTARAKSAALVRACSSRKSCKTSSWASWLSRQKKSGWATRWIPRRGWAQSSAKADAAVPGLHRDRQERRGTALAGGKRARGNGTRLLRRADDFRRREERYADRPEEIFGPVLATLTFDDVEQVAELANQNFMVLPPRCGLTTSRRRTAFAATEGGHSLDQHLWRDGRVDAVWRL